MSEKVIVDKSDLAYLAHSLSHEDGLYIESRVLEEMLDTASPVTREPVCWLAEQHGTVGSVIFKSYEEAKAFHPHATPFPVYRAPPAEGREQYRVNCYNCGPMVHHDDGDYTCADCGDACDVAYKYTAHADIKAVEQALDQLTADAQQQGLYEQPSEAERRKIKLKITSRRNLEPMPIEDEAEQEQPITAQEARQSLYNIKWRRNDTLLYRGSFQNLRRYIEQTAQGAAQDREDAERMEWLEQQVADGNCWFWDYAGEMRWHRENRWAYSKKGTSSARLAIDKARQQGKE